MSDTKRGREAPVFDERAEQPFVWAHRGASALAPENTMRAFQLAAELDAPGIEFDVQLTRDGVPLILHDPWLWTDGSSLTLRRPADEADPGARGSLSKVVVAETDWADLEGRPVRHEDGSTEPIPRFEEVVEAMPAWLWFDVELKAGWGYDPRLAGIAAAVLARRPERVLCSSFDHVILKELAVIAPEMPLLAIVHARPADLAQLLASIPAQMTCIDRPFLTAEDVVTWHEQGLVVSVGGKELLGDLDEVLAWPVAAIFLDDPRLGAGAGAGSDREARQ